MRQDGDDGDLAPAPKYSRRCRPSRSGEAIGGLAPYAESDVPTFRGDDAPFGGSSQRRA